MVTSSVCEVTIVSHYSYIFSSPISDCCIFIFKKLKNKHVYVTDRKLSILKPPLPPPPFQWAPSREGLKTVVLEHVYI
jgi:hypothetical protein